MLILDSNHLRVLQTPGEACDRLYHRLENDGREIATTIINIHEGIDGWLSQIHKSKTAQGKVPGYRQLIGLLEYYADWNILPFDEDAAAQFDALRSMREIRRISTMDLQIAAIALCHNATVLTCNLTHFQIIPKLRVEDWTLDEPSDQPPTL